MKPEKKFPDEVRGRPVEPKGGDGEPITRIMGPDGKAYPSFNGQQQQLINEILETGLYGNTPAALIVRVVDAFLIQYSTSKNDRPIQPLR